MGGGRGRGGELSCLPPSLGVEPDEGRWASLTGNHR